MMNRERIGDIAADSAGEEALFVEERYIGEGSVSLWRGVRTKPARMVAVFEYGDETIIVSQSFGNFEKMLRLARPDLNDVQTITWLIERCAPPRRKVFLSHEEVDPKFRQLWTAPQVGGDGVMLMCNDLARGRMERIAIKLDYSVAVTDIGPGRRIGLR